jgi:hypothetical protein
LQRFLQHVLPDGFKKIRHFGLYASSHCELLELARSQIPSSAPTAAVTASSSWIDSLRALTGAPGQSAGSHAFGSGLWSALSARNPGAATRRAPARSAVSGARCLWRGAMSWTSARPPLVVVMGQTR